MSSLLLALVTSSVGPVLTSLVASLVLVFWSLLVVIMSCVHLAVGLCSCAPDADDATWVTEVCGGESSEAVARDDNASHSWIFGRMSFNCLPRPMHD